MASNYQDLESGEPQTITLRLSFGGRSASTVLSEGALLQLAICFLLSPLRADPYIVGPLVALYALREDDRRALVLYAALSAASVPLDLIYFFSGNASFLVSMIVLGAIALKAGLVYVAVKSHEELPVARPGRTEPAKLQAKVQEVVESVLHEVLDAAPPMPRAKKPLDLAPPPPPEATTAAASAAVRAGAPGAAPPVSSRRHPVAPTPPPPAPGPASARAGAGASDGTASWEEV